MSPEDNGVEARPHGSGSVACGSLIHLALTGSGLCGIKLNMIGRAMAITLI